MRDKYEYDIYTRTDANTKGHNYWFYFSVKSPWHPDRIKKYKDYSSYRMDDITQGNPIKVKFNIFKSINTKGMRI